MNCPHCGGRNFAWTRRCEHCGRSVDPSAPAEPGEPVKPVLPELALALPEPPEVQAREESRAAVRAALDERGTRVVVTPILIAANVAMFLIVAFQDRSIFTFRTETLLGWGASYSPDVAQGEWWRLVTAVFLHGGLLHLASNMFALMIIGQVTERLYGSSAMAVVYALSGIGGAVASEWWKPVAVSVGASGAIFGLYGSLLAFLLLRHAALPRQAVSALGSGAVVVVLYNIAAGFTQSYIDNAGHIGGLLAGVAAGLALVAKGEAKSIPSPRRVVTVAAAGLAITAASVSALPRYGDLRRNLAEFYELDDSTIDAAQRSITDMTTGKVTEDDCATAIEGLLPTWRAQRTALAALQLPPADRDYVTRVVRYMDARDQAWTMTADAIRKRDVGLLAEGQSTHASAVRALSSRSVARRRPGGTDPAGSAITFGTSELNVELRRMQQMDEKFTTMYNDRLAKARSGQVPLPDLAATVEKEIIVPWAGQYERLQALPLHGPPDWTRQPAAEFLRLRIEAWRLMARALRERNPALMKQAMAAQAKASTFAGSTPH